MTQSSRNNAEESIGMQRLQLDPHLQVYQRERNRTALFWVFAGGIHLLYVYWLSTNVLVRLTRFQKPSQLSFPDLPGLFELHTLGLPLLSGLLLIICGLIVWVHSGLFSPWVAIATGFWTTTACCVGIFFSPMCMFMPFYGVLFLQSRSFYESARFLVVKGFDLCNLPVSSCAAVPLNREPTC